MSQSASEEFAAELRAILRAFKERTVPDDALRAASEHARELLALLEGDARPRWFEQGIVDGKSSREARTQFSDFSLFRGRSNPIAAPLQATMVTLLDGRRAIEGRVTVSHLYEGPPHGMHGGYLAGLFDDILGGTQALIEGPSGLTGTLKVRYRNLTPLDTELVFLAWVEHVSGRRIVARATCHAGDLLTAEAEALFVRVDMDALAQRQGTRPPRQQLHE